MAWQHPLFEPYDLLMLAVGVVLLVTTLERSLLNRLNVSPSFLYVAAGAAAAQALTGLIPDDPLQWMEVLKRVSELAVILGLIVLGLKVGRPITWSKWRSTTRLILIVMPATIAAVAVAAHLLFGVPIGPAILLGAILAPTDPILAGPLEEHDARDESEHRFGLSSEAGLNDGLAFPFIYLGLYLTVEPDTVGSWIGRWAALDGVWAIGAALPIGWLIGFLAARWYLRQVEHDAFSHKRREFIPIAVLFVAYGVVEAIGAYGFLAAFTTGLAFRRQLDEHPEELGRFVNFTDSIDALAKAAVLILLGALLPWSALPALALPLAAFALVLIVVVRPGLTLLATVRAGFTIHDRLYWGWFGLRGIGSVYYMAYALSQDLDDELRLLILTITGATILASMVLHGLTVRPYLARWEGERDVEE